MEDGRGVVLVVEQDPEMRDRIGGWLENEGHQVVACPGPSHPDYVCMAGRGVACPLAEAADAVVLDLWLASDSVLTGTPSTQLLSYYLSTGNPVVALSARHDRDRLSNLFLDDALLVLEWPPEHGDLCETVRAVLRHGPSVR